MQRGKAFIVAFLALALLVLAACSDMPAEPGKPGTATRGGNLFGLATGDLFGSPVSSARINPQTVVFDSLDSQSTMNISVNDTAVYRYGYYSMDGGNDWTQYELSGPTSVGNWLIAKGAGTITMNASHANTNGSKYLVLYTCSWVDGWDCHGNVWQRIQFQVSLPSCSAAQCEYNSQCYDANTAHPAQSQICLDGSWVSLPGSPGTI